jgi:hypothetical protein
MRVNKKAKVDAWKRKVITYERGLYGDYFPGIEELHKYSE